jgi:hypothetical protein
MGIALNFEFFRTIARYAGLITISFLVWLLLTIVFLTLRPMGWDILDVVKANPLSFIAVISLALLSFIVFLNFLTFRNKYWKVVRSTDMIASEWYAKVTTDALGMYEDVIALRAKLENFRRLRDPDPSLLALVAQTHVRLNGAFAPTEVLQDFVAFRGCVLKVRAAAIRVNQRVAAETVASYGINREDVRVKIESLCVSLHASFKVIEEGLIDLSSGRCSKDHSNDDLYGSLTRLKHEFEARLSQK